MVGGGIGFSNVGGCFIASDQIAAGDDIVSVEAIPTVVEFRRDYFVSNGKACLRLPSNVGPLGCEPVVVTCYADQIVFGVASIQHRFMEIITAQQMLRFGVLKTIIETAVHFGFGLPVIHATGCIQVHSTKEMSARIQL